MNNCSEYGCRSIGNQTVHTQFGVKLYCDMHFRNKIQILKPQRTVKIISEAFVELKNLILETSSKILLESAQTIKAVQLKTQTALDVLNRFLKESKNQIELFESKVLKLNEDFSMILDGEPHFFNHFQELSKKIKVFEINFKSKNIKAHCWKPVEKPEKKITIPKLEKNYENLNSDTISLPIKIAPNKKDYEDFAPETVTIPQGSSFYRKVYHIETKDGFKKIPNYIVDQIEKAILRNQNSVEIYNNGKRTNFIDLVNWKSYKINENGEIQTFYYKIHVART